MHFPDINDMIIAKRELKIYFLGGLEQFRNESLMWTKRMFNFDINVHGPKDSEYRKYYIVNMHTYST